ncbi:MAG: SpoIIE family protein phosphatase [Hyphomicrobiales bacterium]|nr:SpoIIE family protein phosphatase [Hyphomicrobiales bacterium]MBV8661827.1 SpoIIE family protein phosphatase [Hyphomicrobiales bacterium]
MSFPPFSRGVSLKIVITLTYVGLVVGCAAAIAFFTYRENSRLILDIANESFEKTGASTIDNTKYLLQPVGAAIDTMTTLIDDDPTVLDQPSLMKFLYEVTLLYPQVYSAYAAAADDGRFTQVQRIDPTAKTWGLDAFPVPDGGQFALRVIFGREADRIDSYRYIGNWGDVRAVHAIGGLNYDPRTRPFYEAAMRQPDRVLTDSYVFASNGKLGITIARKLEHDGKQVGVVAADITLDSLSSFLTEQPVGAHGVAIIVDDRGGVVAAPRPGADAAASAAPIRAIKDFGRPELDRAWSVYKGDGKRSFVFDQSGQEYIAAFYPFPKSFDKAWTIMEVAPIDDFVGKLKDTIREIGLLSIGVGALGAFASLLMAGQITKPIEMVTQEADRIRSLSFAGAIKNTSHIREIARLIDSMSAMKTAIRTFAGDEKDQEAFATLLQQADQQSPSAKLFKKVVESVEAKRARETELMLATAIQHSVLPVASDTGPDRGVQIAARMRAAKEVGGDFYDWMWRDDGRLAFVVGDVSGKGVPAALFMSSTRTAIRTMFMAGASLEETVSGANRLLSENNDGCFFVTIFIAELDPSTGRLSYINAGHEPARVRTAAGATTNLEPESPALGVVEDAEFRAVEIILAAGDTLVALTDGVTDAVNAAGERFGDDKFDEMFAAEPTLSPAGVVAQIFSAVDVFAGDEQQFDDITCLVLRLSQTSTRASI